MAVLRDRGMAVTEIQARCVDFGRALLFTGDLDPLYVMVYAAQMKRRELGRFLLGYGMFYHAGVAAMLTRYPRFWEQVEELLPYAPRGTERRHFRGELARSSVKMMRELGPPEVALSHIYPDIYPGERPLTFSEVFEGAQTLRGFGPWIAFKMADIAERVAYRYIDFTGCELSIYRDPVKGAALWRYGDQDATIQPGEVSEVCEEIRVALGADLLAPPLYDRPINVQEVETVLCKFKSHYNGHYPIGKDTREILHGLDGYGPLADRLAHYGGMLL